MLAFELVRGGNKIFIMGIKTWPRHHPGALRDFLEFRTALHMCKAESGIRARTLM